MRFSICIPNYNYEKFLGRTLDSALHQQGGELEVLVSDNASTDGSAALVRARAAADPRVKLSVNPCNVGFAGNLDRVRAHSGDVLNDAGLVDSATIRKDLRRLRLRLARHGCSGLDDVYDHLTEVIARRPAEPPAPFDFDDSW